MSSLTDRVLAVLRERPTEPMSAIQVCRALAMNTAEGGDRYIRAVANELCTAVELGFVTMRLPQTGDPDCRYTIKEMN